MNGNPYSYEVVVHDKIDDDVIDIEPLATYYFDTDSGAETFKRGIIRQGRVAKINKINLNNL
jgi:hypothetical protein